MVTVSGHSQRARVGAQLPAELTASSQCGNALVFKVNMQESLMLSAAVYMWL